MNIAKFAINTALIGLLQIPALLPQALQNILPPSISNGVSNTANVLVGQVQSGVNDLASAFFGSSATPNEIQSVINHEMEYVSSRPAYAASLAVMEQYQGVIKQYADKFGVPEDVAIGVAFLENGGSANSVSTAGAVGIFQLMPATARGLGLTVNKTVDQRNDPTLNIEAGVKYLAENYARFGDWGLATWAYHAGEGNVSKAMTIYSRANGATADNVNQLLSDPSVKQFADNLHDDSVGYPYKVLATATLFSQANT